MYHEARPVCAKRGSLSFSTGKSGEASGVDKLSGDEPTQAERQSAASASALKLALTRLIGDP
jgi:hypothetical protein